ncbi:MAG: putative mannose-phosphate guanylyltransferase [Ilumatobacteraceae bacterium]|nr:putative mannose-phosphate guanylyltransferase [Ilumatobacteraceae bacterium]MCU1389614.1 putative mannose-phosphate guanylyltransferase [Ilumatobacteraceae bacterium]
MRAVVLVGGFGTRLRPLTLSVPKPMLPVGHVSIIERLIGNLVRGGVTEVVLALGFKPEPFVTAFPDGTCAGAKLTYAVEPEPLDTAGAIGFAAAFAGIDDTFVVANGDILTDLDIAELVAFHRSHGAEATLHLTPVEDPSAFGVVDREDSGLVRRFIEKPPPGTSPSNLINAGTYVFEPSVLARIPTGRKVSVEREVFPQIVESHGLFAMPTDDYWVDTGTPELYLLANIDMVTGRRAEHSSAVGLAVGATVGVDVSLRDSVVAAGATVRDGASVVSSVVLDGGHIGVGATVSHSVVMGRIEDGATVSNCVIGADGVVGNGESRNGERIPAPVA